MRISSWFCYGFGCGLAWLRLVRFGYKPQELSNYHGNSTKTNLGLRVLRTEIEMHIQHIKGIN